MMSDFSGPPATSENEQYFRRIPVGPIELADIPEIIRAMRHVLVNQHDGLRSVHLTAKDAEHLGKKALERLDDIAGVPGYEHIDGGGAIGRMQTSLDHIEKLLNRATWAIVAGSLTLAGDIAVHFLPVGK